MRLQFLRLLPNHQLVLPWPRKNSICLRSIIFCSMSDFKQIQPLQSREEEQIIHNIKNLSLKDLSVQVHHLLVQQKLSNKFWAAVENQFLLRIQPTTDSFTIRSYSKILYSLSKSKQSQVNYESKMGLLLPFATPMSFTTIATALSRMGPLSQEMGYIIEKLYYKRRQEFSGRQRVSINYVMCRNDRPIDTSLIECIDGLNCVETTLMLRVYDISSSLNANLLLQIFKKLSSTREEMNVLDLADFIEIYLKHDCVTKEVQTFIEMGYFNLRRNVNEIALLKIWRNMPDSLNKGHLRVKFVMSVARTMALLHKHKMISQKALAELKLSFGKVQNLELRVKLQEIV